MQKIEYSEYEEMHLQLNKEMKFSEECGWKDSIENYSKIINSLVEKAIKCGLNQYTEIPVTNLYNLSTDENTYILSIRAW